MQVLNAANSVSDNNIVHFCGWDEWKNRFSCWRNYPARTVNWAIYVDGMDLVRGRDYFLSLIHILTTSSRSTHCSAIWDSCWPRANARSLSFCTLAIFSGVMLDALR